jgi:hypothetical protein
MHQHALHGTATVALAMIAGVLAPRTEPRIKLH